MSDLDRVLGELARLMRRSSQLPEDAYEERAALQSRREELRARAAALRGPARAHPDRSPEQK